MRILQTTAKKISGLLGRESLFIRKLRPAYESLLDLTAGGRGIPWEINGVTYRVDPRQRHRLGQNYDAPVAAFIREHIKPGALCFDIGANVGVYVLQFAHWSGATGRVVAFEPNPGALKSLHRHIELNGLGERVRVVPAAVGASAGKATLFASGTAGMSRLGAPNKLIAAQTKELSVTVVTLDEFCEAEGLEPDWLFLDIEGFEFAALEGARRLIERRGDALHIVVEMHSGVWESAGTSRASADALLRELKLRAVPLTGQSDPLGDHGIVCLKQADVAKATVL
ncbi:MAG: FkbM family methyltransferase [Acidobacteria bacterium]|nr:FkbM family methyltransferase [Acidobacteriota bacterium]